MRHGTQMIRHGIETFRLYDVDGSIRSTVFEVDVSRLDVAVYGGQLFAIVPVLCGYNMSTSTIALPGA